jgi:hypothetical protein
MRGKFKDPVQYVYSSIQLLYRSKCCPKPPAAHGGLQRLRPYVATRPGRLRYARKTGRAPTSSGSALSSRGFAGGRGRLFVTKKPSTRGRPLAAQQVRRAIDAPRSAGRRPLLSRGEDLRSRGGRPGRVGDAVAVGARVRTDRHAMRRRDFMRAGAPALTLPRALASRLAALSAGVPARRI